MKGVRAWAKSNGATPPRWKVQLPIIAVVWAVAVLTGADPAGAAIGITIGWAIGTVGAVYLARWLRDRRRR